MSCLSVNVSRIGQGIDATMDRVRGGIVVRMTKKSGASFRMGLVCGNNLGLGILWASDERLIIAEGGYLIVN